MTEYVSPDGAPIYFANIVTSNMFPDELIVEFRRFIQEHRKILAPSVSATVSPIKPPPPEEVYSVTPIARVVLTFSAAKDLRDYLNAVIPEMEKRRGK